MEFSLDAQQLKELHDRIASADARRKNLETQVAKLTGVYEAAKASLAQVESECREKGFDPSKLAETEIELETKLKEALDEYEAALVREEAKLTPLQPYLQAISK